MPRRTDLDDDYLYHFDKNFEVRRVSNPYRWQVARMTVFALVLGPRRREDVSHPDALLANVEDTLPDVHRRSQRLLCQMGACP